MHAFLRVDVAARSRTDSPSLNRPRILIFYLLLFLCLASRSINEVLYKVLPSGQLSYS